MGDLTPLGAELSEVKARIPDSLPSDNSIPDPPVAAQPIDVCPGDRCDGRRGEVRYVPDGDGGGIPVHSEYCSCPAGESARSDEDKIRQAYRNGLRRARVERYFKSSGVPAKYAAASFDGYPVSPETMPVVERLRSYAASCGQGEGRSLMIWGDYGRGKTGLAVATLRAAVEAHGLDAYFTTVPDLLAEIKAGFGGRVRMPYPTDDESGQMSAGELQRMVRSTTLLVLDDLGAERVTSWVAEEMFALINHRHNRDLRTIFTSNLSTEELAEHLGERTVWRIVAMSEVIRLDGPNLRLQGKR